MTSIDNTIKSVFSFKDLLSTKFGLYVAFVIFLIIAFLAVLWLVNDQRVIAIEERKEALSQVAAVNERITRIEDECFETVQKWFTLVYGISALTADKVNAISAIKMQTNAVIQQQQGLIYQSAHDETN